MSHRAFTRASVATLIFFIFASLPSLRGQTGASSVAQPAAERVLFPFAGGAYGSNPEAGVIFAKNGNLYGSTVNGGRRNCGTIFALDASRTYSVKVDLHVFGCAPSDGAMPRGNLIVDVSGNLYGVTSRGGTFDQGTVFELTLGPGGWAESVLYSFAGGDDGSHPNPSLIFDGSGNLYGVTASGGGTLCGGSGCGTVFSLTRSAIGWNETILFKFDGTDGQAPRSIVFGPAGNLYGVTYGGKNDFGTVFELTPGASRWFEKSLYAFTNSADSAHPWGGIVLDAAGNIYGTTSGIRFENCSPPSCGTVFELKRGVGGWEFDTLYTFGGMPDGNSPAGALTIDGDGNLYGTTLYGGVQDSGTVFELTSSSGGWTENLLHSFGGPGDGTHPAAGLLLDKAGYLFGTTLSGADALGSVFEIKP